MAFNTPIQAGSGLQKVGNALSVDIDDQTSKATPVDADETYLADSASSFAIKKLIWSNLKATLKAYFDTLYTTVGLDSLTADYATTAALPTGVYVNGVAGIGATFTVTATGTVTVDGHVLAAGDRLLVLNQASTFQNGLYKVTIAGAIGVSLVITRSVDMDQSNEFQGALVAVINGTANAGTYWTETAVVNTVGADAVTFNQFTPQLPAQAANTLLGNNTGSSAVPVGLTSSQVRTLLSLVIGTNVQAWSNVLDALTSVMSSTATAVAQRAALGVYGGHTNTNSGTAATLDFSTGHTQELTLTGNCTLTFSNPQTWETYVVRLTQDGTGSRTVTWPAAVKWAGGTTPTLTTTAGEADMFAFSWNGTDYFGVASGLNYTP